jgi:hypothetical protein
MNSNNSYVIDIVSRIYFCMCIGIIDVKERRNVKSGDGRNLFSQSCRRIQGHKPNKDIKKRDKKPTSTQYYKVFGKNA